MDNFNHLSPEENLQIETLYQDYLLNPNSVDDNWRVFFEGYEFAQLNPPSVSPSDISSPETNFQKEFKVVNLINGYRNRGHLFTKTNPVRERRQYLPTLALENFGLNNSDLESVFQAGSLIGIGAAKLKDIIAYLLLTYCESVGAEYKYIRTPEVVDWLEQKMERAHNSKTFSVEEKKRILKKVNEAVAFESFIHTKFVGQKSFSLEGCEALIPALDAVIEFGAELGIKEFVIGMAHRGRLNVLANILGKSYEEIFTEFEGLDYNEIDFSGDVKYHLGYSSEIKTANGKEVHLSVAPNPSHLEAVDPVVQGIVRSRIDNLPNGNEKLVAPILIHGDAAIAGQGVVYEVIQMSQLNGFKTGGTIHLVINNQIGFTTNYLDGRSSTYCTDVAKVTLSPVFHVNGDDVEALIYTIQLAMEFRQTFHRDVFIDILAYRKYGHNENDEPRFTQPLLYKLIAAHPNLKEIYTKKLLGQKAIDLDYVKAMELEFKTQLQKNLDQAKQATIAATISPPEYHKGTWKGLRFANENDFENSPETGVAKNILTEIGDKISDLPSGKKFFDKTVKLFADRKLMIQNGEKINWAVGELLAYGTLLHEGFPIWFSGQDVERGTFSHRHAVIPVENSEEHYTPLNNIKTQQAPLYIYNSLLSEYAVLGFEYGYAISSPNTLVIWEAQFGDFGNGAQVMIDQYLSSAEDKWKQMAGIVLLLPHGYEGQGAEHSSARLERYLQLCAEKNMQVVNCTTPANFFHVMRRQLKREFRKPLIVLTPKSLLRHPRCVSRLDDFSQGNFQEIIDDSTSDISKITRLVFCSGKFYYDLLAQKEKENNSTIALIRLEQIYPFPQKQFETLISKYKNASEIFWAQEEPENMGAWEFLLRTVKNISLKLISRKESASAATGSHHAHDREQLELIEKVFGE
ncbi:MAG: 2-oxoglutarate dehydrogenase E1 component [Bacteroidetes bacterium]|nr:2-oxoglutarate dehydrogenase E1 component [Bacteroidota bacterium]